jgi:hypothetical protein
MSKPKKPPNFNEYLKQWQAYFVRYEKYLIRKRQQGKRYRVKHYEKEIQRHRDLRKNFPEKCRAYDRKYRLSDKGRASMVKKSYRFLDNHPEIPERYLEFVERMIKITEGNIGLERVL